MEELIQAVLPAQRKQRQIQDLEPGESGWTVPWAVVADSNGRLWINVEMAIFQNPFGTIEMEVTHLERGAYAIDARKTDFQWTLTPHNARADHDFRPVLEATF